MAYRVTSFQPTPNPHALKCVLDRPLPDPVRSFRRSEDAAADPLASALFAIPGVTGLLLSGGWFTVNKSPDADWSPIKNAVQAVLTRSV